MWKSWEERSGRFRVLSAGLGRTAEGLVFADSNGEEVVTQAPWNHGPEGE